MVAWMGFGCFICGHLQWKKAASPLWCPAWRIAPLSPLEFLPLAFADLRETLGQVGGWPTPLKNMKVSWDDYYGKIWKHKKCLKPPTSDACSHAYISICIHIDITYFCACEGCTWPRLFTITKGILRNMTMSTSITIIIHKSWAVICTQTRVYNHDQLADGPMCMESLPIFATPF